MPNPAAAYRDMPCSICGETILAGDDLIMAILGRLDEERQLADHNRVKAITTDDHRERGYLMGIRRAMAIVHAFGVENKNEKI